MAPKPAGWNSSRFDVFGLYSMKLMNKTHNFNIKQECIFMKTCEIEARLKFGNDIIRKRDVTKANIGSF